MLYLTGVILHQERFDGMNLPVVIAALAFLYSTTEGMAVQVAGLRQHVDPHWNRGLSYLKIGLRWLKGVIYKGRQLLSPIPLLPKDQEPCFASNKARQDI
ncbi:hypothetical protein [Brasilonema bromeliae]|nr:hypothetical protein [Brasilonema bromeliae]